MCRPARWRNPAYQVLLAAIGDAVPPPIAAHAQGDAREEQEQRGGGEDVEEAALHGTHGGLCPAEDQSDQSEILAGDQSGEPRRPDVASAVQPDEEDEDERAGPVAERPKP